MNISSINIIGSGSIGLYLYSAFKDNYRTSLFSVRTFQRIHEVDLEMSVNGQSSHYVINSCSTFVYECDLLIYTGLISSISSLNLGLAKVLICSNLCCFLPQSIASKSFFSVVQNISSLLQVQGSCYSVVSSSFSTPKLITNMPVTLKHNNYIDYLCYSSDSNYILVKGLRTIFFVFYFNRHILKTPFDLIESELNILANDLSFSVHCHSILNKLSDKFTPSILSPCPHHRNELNLLLNYFIEFIQADPSRSFDYLLLESYFIMETLS